MAYKLNLVTMDIRKRMADSVKEEKVHDKEKTYVSTEEDKYKKQDLNKEKPNEDEKRYLTIDAVKNKKEKVDVAAEIDKKNILDKEALGIFIDKKK